MEREIKEEILQKFNFNRHLRNIWKFVVASGREFGFEEKEGRNPESEDLEALYNQATNSYIALYYMFREPGGDACVGGKVQIELK